jgi:glycosyltransferase involved in cell wall biosynthesis
MAAPLFIDWQIGAPSGWGTFGLQIALRCLARGDYRPVPLMRPHTRHAGSHAPLLEELAATGAGVTGLIGAGGPPLRVRGPVLHALGNGFHGSRAAGRVIGAPRIGIVFLEDTALDAAALERAGRFDRVVAGSSWNARLLRDRGVAGVELCLQGVDPTVFHPPAAPRPHADRFVVFSGGKLEFRKGQDLVVAAFREFRRRHTDAVLMTAWHNPWPETMGEVGLRGHVEGVPERRDRAGPDLAGWLERNGVPREAVVDPGVLDRERIAARLREADVALFPNRAEGGTNLVAMEAMACGVPTILSANTGHLDLIEPANCYPLRRQAPVEPSAGYRGMDGWGESDVEEIVEALEIVYRDRKEALRRGIRGSETVRRLAWPRQVDRLLAVVAG